MLLTFSLLALAVLSLWCSGDETSGGLRRHFWLVVWLFSLVSAIACGAVTALGAGIALTFMGVVFAFQRADKHWQLALAATAVLGLSIALLLHRLPGFNNPRVIDAVHFTPDARPFTLYLNFDKTLIGLFILGWCHRRLASWRDWKTMLTTTLPWSSALIGLLMTLSLAMGYVRFAPKFPAQSWLWLLVNLLFVCTAEEAFFRGFVQTQLQRLWKNRSGGRVTALIVASLLFGLAHFGGGWAYVALATVAGLGYGSIYQRTQRIEASILTHFALNTVHFFLFTYPALAPGK